MKLIKPSFEILDQGPGLEGIYEAIERAGRTCYKSTRLEGQTAKNFVNNLIKRGHGAMLEHGTVYLKIPVNIDVAGDFLDDVYTWTKCKLVTEESGNWWAVTTNYRRIVELGYQDYLQYLCEPTEYHEKRIAVRFVTSIGIGRELLRHRVFSFANESTRYCNYSKDKFNNEVTFIIPSWTKSLQEGILEYSPFEITCEEAIFMENCYRAEKYYFAMLNNEATPQEAREVLPLATKSELIMTGFISDWEHLFQLRSAIAATGKPHPDMVALIDPLMQEFIKRNLITE